MFREEFLKIFVQAASTPPIIGDARWIASSEFPTVRLSPARAMVAPYCRVELSLAGPEGLMQAFCTRSLLFAMSMAFNAPTSWASNFTLTMDDLPIQPVNGLVHSSGVTFGFTVSGRPNDDARYAAGGPGSIEFVQDPSIEGTAMGVLSIRFSQPATPISFGVARSLFNTSTANVELFDATNTSLGVQVLPLAPMPTYPEGRFSHSGQAISRLTVSFPPPDQSRFAFDNLTFRLIPEPATLVMAFVAAAFGLAGRQRRN